MTTFAEWDSYGIVGSDLQRANEFRQRAKEFRRRGDLQRANELLHRVQRANEFRQRAVELLEQQIDFAELEKEETITLPVFGAKVILSCARDGQHKGQGRRRPRDTQMDRLAKRAVVGWACKRQDELVAAGLKTSRAKDQAATEAQANFGKRTGLSAPEIRRRMAASNPNFSRDLFSHFRALTSDM